MNNKINMPSTIITELAKILSEGECIDIDGNRQLTLEIPNNPNNGKNFKEEKEKQNIEDKKRRKEEAAKKAMETRKLNKEAKNNAQKNALGLNIVEEIINEISDELANRVHAQRIENVANARTKEDILDTNNKARKNIELMNNRDHRKDDKKEKIQKFKDFYKDKIANIKDINKAGEEQSNARINQGLRNKLERIYALESLLEEFLNETSDYFRTTYKQKVAKAVLPDREKKFLNAMDVVSRAANKMEKNIEQGKDIPQALIKTASRAAVKADKAQDKVKHAQNILKEAIVELYNILENNKPINFRKEQIAKKVNDMMMSGETDKVRQTDTGKILGDIEVVNKLNDLKNELKGINKSEDKNG